MRCAAAAQRIVWGNFNNAGQTCVAQDYLLVHENRKNELIDKMKAACKKMYGANPQLSNDYGRIINERRFDTLVSYLQQGTIINGGGFDKKDLYIAPTLMEDVALQQPLMQEEIFGPILPVRSFKEHDEAMQIIAENANPLSLYIFSNNSKVQDLYMNNVAFGGGCINNTLMHLANPDLPFGGVDSSGFGQYHGKFGFDAFTRPKAVLQSATWIDPSVKYPPYKGKLKILKWLIK
jgi:aldehyde dehydrogenase (NAD+)